MTDTTVLSTFTGINELGAIPKSKIDRTAADLKSDKKTFDPSMLIFLVSRFVTPFGVPVFLLFNPV